MGLTHVKVPGFDPLSVPEKWNASTKLFSGWVFFFSFYSFYDFFWALWFFNRLATPWSSTLSSEWDRIQTRYPQSGVIFVTLWSNHHHLWSTYYGIKSTWSPRPRCSHIRRLVLLTRSIPNAVPIVQTRHFLLSIVKVPTEEIKVPTEETYDTTFFFCLHNSWNEMKGPSKSSLGGPHMKEIDGVFKSLQKRVTWWLLF